MKTFPRTNDSDQPAVIVFNRKRFCEVREEVYEAIRQRGSDPVIFQSGGRLVRLRRFRLGCEFQEVRTEHLRTFVDQLTLWTYATQKGTQTPKLPPWDFVEDMLAQASWPTSVFPELDAVVRIPVFDTSGKIIDRPGYHAEARLWFEPEANLTIPEISEMPNADDVASAVQFLSTELFGDFPFVDDASRAHAIAFLLSSFVRLLIAGPIPMLVIEAATPGTGNGLLGDAIGFPATGEPLPRTAQPESNQEWRKMVTAALVEPHPFILVDNLVGTLRSAPLEQVLTAEVWSDRVLGETRKITVPARSIWMATANNLEVAGDLPRRLVWVRLDAKMEHPETRKPEDFRHPDLIGWARQNRGELIHSVLTIVQAWIAQGMPRGNYSLGSFQSWAETIGGILDVAGVQGFLVNASSKRLASDEEAGDWRTLCKLWWSEHGRAEVGAKDLYILAAEADLFPWLMNIEAEDSRRKKLGHKLRKVIDRLFGDFRIVEASRDNSNRRKYRLEVVGDLDEPCSETGSFPVEEMNRLLDYVPERTEDAADTSSSREEDDDPRAGEDLNDLDA